jgi:hypothetical protein
MIARAPLGAVTTIWLDPRSTAVLEPSARALAGNPLASMSSPPPASAINAETTRSGRRRLSLGLDTRRIPQY